MSSAIIHPTKERHENQAQHKKSRTIKNTCKMNIATLFWNLNKTDTTTSSKPYHTTNLSRSNMNQINSIKARRDGVLRRRWQGAERDKATIQIQISMVYGVYLIILIELLDKFISHSSSSRHQMILGLKKLIDLRFHWIIKAFDLFCKEYISITE